MLFRVRHLLQDPRYSVDGARRRLWQETERIDPVLRAQLAEIRDQLVAALIAVRAARRALDGNAPDGGGAAESPAERAGEGGASASAL